MSQSSEVEVFKISEAIEERTLVDAVKFYTDIVEAVNKRIALARKRELVEALESTRKPLTMMSSQELYTFGDRCQKLAIQWDRLGYQAKLTDETEQ